MRRLLPLLGLLFSLGFSVPARAQFTQVSGQVLDVNGSVYSSCSMSVQFIPSPTATQIPTLGGNGQTFQTSFPLATCDTQGNFSLTLADNSQVTDGHTGPVASQWSFRVCSSPGAFTPQLCFSTTLTITGIGQNITSSLQAVAVTLPIAGGVGPGLAGNLAIYGSPSTLSNAGIAVYNVLGLNGVSIDGCSSASNPKYACTAAGINLAGATLSGNPGVVFVPDGNFTLSDAVIAVAKNEVLIFGSGVYTYCGLTQPDSTTDTTGTSAVYGQGIDRTTLFISNGCNKDGITDPNFATLTGSSNFYGVYHSTVAHLTVNGNASNQSGTSYCFREYGRANFVYDFDFYNCKNDDLYFEWGGTASFILPTGDLEWRIHDGKTRYGGGNGITDKASSDAIVDSIVSYKNTAWGVETFYSMHLNGFNGYLQPTGGCHANGTGGVAAAFFGSDDECTSGSGYGFLSDATGAVGASVINGIFGATGGTAISIGAQGAQVTGQCVNSTTCLAFTGSENGSQFYLTTYGDTGGPLVKFNSLGGDSLIMINGNGAGTMFDATPTLGAEIHIDVIGVTNNPFLQLRSSGSGSTTISGVNPQLTLIGPSSAAQEVLSAQAGTQASFVLQSTTTPEWQFGKQTSNAWFLFDSVNNQTRMAATQGGEMQFPTLATDVVRLKTNQGTAYTGADAAIVPNAVNGAGGWGSGAVVASSVGYDSALSFSVTAAGTPGANPTTVITFKDGTWTTAPQYICVRNDTVSPVASGPPLTWNATATTLTLTFIGTPVAASTYGIVCHALGN